MDFSQCREASHSHVRKILVGIIQSIETMGIITAWNPQGQQADEDFNTQANAKLYGSLCSRGLGPIQVKGQFMGNPEVSFLVPNIEREFLVGLCCEYDQFAVIYGEKTNVSGSPALQLFMVNGIGQDVVPPEIMVISTGGYYGQGGSRTGAVSPG